MEGKNGANEPAIDCGIRPKESQSCRCAVREGTDKGSFDLEVAEDPHRIESLNEYKVSCLV